MCPDISESERIPRLRAYYLSHAQMAVDRSLVPWKCKRSLLLYREGWEAARDTAPTVRLRRSQAEAYMLKHTAPVIFPGDLIVGQPDFSPYTPEEEKRNSRAEMIGIGMPELRGRPDHLALDYPMLLEQGIGGVLQTLHEKQDALDLFDGKSAEDWEFYECCITELEGVLELQHHYCEAALNKASASTGTEKEELLALAQTLRQVPEKPARTFREALQSVHFFLFSLYGIYSAGRPDQYLLPYYRRDLAAGVLTQAGAQELIDCFCLQYIANMSQWAAAGFMLGGRDADGRPVENELTWHFLAGIRHTHAPDPNIGFCVTEQTSPEILRFAAELNLEGHAQPQIWNSDAVTRSMRRNGYDESASYLFTHSTCVEITPIGRSGVSITSPYINVLGIFMKAFRACRDGDSFEDLWNGFEKEFRAYWKTAFLQENLWQMERARNCTDPMRISVFIHSCIENRRSNDAGGADYNLLEPNLLGMTNTIESLNVIRKLIFEEKLLTFSSFQKILDDNYQGHEDILQKIRCGVVHFGVGDPEADALAKRVADLLLSVFGECRTVRGASVVPGAFSYRDHALHGSETPATPDGRCAGMPLADGSGPVQGYDDCGPTLSLVSTTAWEPARFLGGTSVNVKLDRRTPVETLIALIHGYLRTEGAQIQFTVVDPQELLDAKIHPDAHRDLLVRIGGYSDFFVRLPESLQDDVISRAQNGCD